MSKKRQDAAFERVGIAGCEITTFKHNYPAHHRVRLHFHDRDQLLYATCGVMTVSTDKGTWVVPTHRAVWIPTGIAHAIVMSGAVSMRALYLKARLARHLPRTCCVLNVTPLLRELIVHTCASKELNRRVRWQRHLIDVVVDQLESIQLVPLQLPNPSDSRTLRITKLLLATPGDRRPLGELCRSTGASKRTVERLFVQEMGMTPGKWRQQLRLMCGLRLLAGGAKVTQAALEAGYNTPSAFITMFRRALGTTPRSYLGDHFRAQAPTTRRAQRHAEPPDGS